MISLDGLFNLILAFVEDGSPSLLLVPTKLGNCGQVLLDAMYGYDDYRFIMKVAM